MATVEDVARATLAAIDSDAGVILAGQWVRDRYRQVASRSRLRSLRRTSQLSLPARVTAGTVTATLGNSTIVGDSTAAAAWTADLIGRHIRVRNAWYEINAINGTSLVLNVPFAEQTASAFSYNIVQRFHELPSEVLHLGSFVHERRWQPLTRISQAELDKKAPARPNVGTTPIYYSEASPHLSGNKRVEIYPYMTDVEVVTYVYWTEPPALDLLDQIPGNVPAWILREGALIDLYRYEAARKAKVNEIDAAAYYRNEARAQKTQWETKDIQEAIRADTGVDDIVFIAQRAGRILAGDVTTAAQHVWLG